jgi:hypothetical protein
MEGNDPGPGREVVEVKDKIRKSEKIRSFLLPSNSTKHVWRPGKARLGR